MYIQFENMKFQFQNNTNAYKRSSLFPCPTAGFQKLPRWESIMQFKCSSMQTDSTYIFLYGIWNKRIVHVYSAFEPLTDCLSLLCKVINKSINPYMIVSYQQVYAYGYRYVFNVCTVSKTVISQVTQSAAAVQIFECHTRKNDITSFTPIA